MDNAIWSGKAFRYPGAKAAGAAPRIICALALSVLLACGGGGNGSGGSSAAMPTIASQLSILSIHYGSAPQQFGVLHIPKNGGPPYPVVVLFHGGCWQSSIAGYTNTEALASALADDGWAVWNVEYRTVDDEGGGWPNTFLDAAAAVDYVRELKNAYPLDIARLIFIGHSAGGHLALWAASRNRIPAGSVLESTNPLLPLRVIGLGAITDLDGYDHAGGTCRSAIPTLIGNADPDEVSPLQMLPIGMPALLITGADDTVVPFSQADTYARSAQALGAVVQITTVDLDHFSLINPDSSVRQLIENELNMLPN